MRRSLITLQRYLLPGWRADSHSPQGRVDTRCRSGRQETFGVLVHAPATGAHRTSTSCFYSGVMRSAMRLGVASEGPRWQRHGASHCHRVVAGVWRASRARLHLGRRQQPSCGKQVPESGQGCWRTRTHRFGLAPAVGKWPRAKHGRAPAVQDEQKTSRSGRQDVGDYSVAIDMHTP